MDKPTSLQNLRDIAEPAPVPWWPPAVGWWILAVAMAAFAVWIASRAWRRWRSDAYRRAALKELSSATQLTEIAEILKRTALCAFPRTDVASLSGDAWSSWLRQTVDQELPVAVAETLEHGIFDGIQCKNNADVASFVATWIRHHRSGDC
ncbi:DUF4381 domain-containing protein [Adhaeretor mobilis]|uniref:DUF4381 domain-containing protein n=1 Tax=Adhaeretor mobilis TaxID=1930276 RepID=A0A517MSU2_9BACT|nr:DUF4381 domain-containing protein [Adhaeretor mobilis]QDS97955.1 hypothetical protein HG15A2_12250 [Adhaeretor mobilis]